MQTHIDGFINLITEHKAACKSSQGLSFESKRQGTVDIRDYYGILFQFEKKQNLRRKLGNSEMFKIYQSESET